MDIGWLLVGIAGVAGGLALVLVGAGIATAPMLLPVGLALAVAAYLAWAVGSARVVATVYADVGDPDREAAADGRGDRPEDRTDPDGNWRSTAADGGRTAGDRAPGGTTDSGHGPGERPDSAAADRSGPAADGAGLGPDGERIWDARERDRVGGWDDWETDWEWADRHWRSFQREYGDADWTAEEEDAGRADSRRSGSGTGARQRTRTSGTRSRSGERRSGGAGPQREHRRDRRAQQARDVLGVPADADAATVRQAYRARVKEVHPDRGGDPEAFKRVQWAYEYLSDP